MALTVLRHLFVIAHVVPSSFIIPNLITYTAIPSFADSMPSPLKKSKLLDAADVPVPSLANKTSEDNVLSFAKLTEHAFPPVKGSEQAAGLDLKSAYAYVVKAHGKELIKTDLQVRVPPGTYGRVAPRSGLAWKNFIDVGAGVIDADYRGNVGVILFNHSDEDFTVNPGDRVAQLICERIVSPRLMELETLDETIRGDGGFGSTGTN
ncbi:dUTPase, trimeric,Deoxyuridine triphosphate nucleotidohydrolase,dUTPase-like [Cinara cedri]|uniref:Deoxyuridine 5'-triphosphate nucleotidohydrolase n=1 Tax=Cinara cedri TaxID=506608 RepID=A0A5E4MLW0_9HEMI|nr:dUTPase, trimeric,Deoxyuridine triphosphate nucleotidohydrolase,dUTPase-like [Cinara cedri]